MTTLRPTVVDPNLYPNLRTPSNLWLYVRTLQIRPLLSSNHSSVGRRIRHFIRPPDSRWSRRVSVTPTSRHWLRAIMVTSLRSKWAAGKARGGRISESIRNRRATRPPAHFQRNPPGRGRLAVFPRCSLGPYGSRYGRFARALKNSQLTCGDITIICETVH
jgi:hypothetical protein